MYDELVKRLREDAEDGYLIYTRIGDDIAKAADAIEELSKPKWIPVEERMPEKSCKCLVYTERGEYGGYDITSYDEMTMTFLDYEIGCEKVTHWMPLPTEPQKEE